MANHLALLLYVHLHGAVISAADPAVSSAARAVAPAGDHVTPGGGASPRVACGDERGQATTEYALVLLAAALVGLMVVAWATAGGGAQRISQLFNGVIDAVIDRI
jgi:hypothetical protein